MHQVRDGRCIGISDSWCESTAVCYDATVISSCVKDIVTRVLISARPVTAGMLTNVFCSPSYVSWVQSAITSMLRCFCSMHSFA